MKRQIIFIFITLLVINTLEQAQTFNENFYEPDIKAYSGPLIMGEDLMSFSVDDSVYVNARKEK